MTEQEGQYSLSPYKVLLEYLQSSVAEENKAFEDSIDETEIVHTVMSAVGGSTTSIWMTMDLAEELISSLPTSYHLLLSQKLDKGIRITRVGFGTEQEFLQIAQTRSFPSENFTFIHNPNMSDYQRMILLDEGTLFFRYGGVFFRSIDPTMVEKFQLYFLSVSRWRI